jgi:hypothetical protein
VHGLIHRHRRKAGSGPPATVLIAWICADPHLRNAVAAAANRRRETDLPPPANTLSATAAVAACFVLVGGAVLGITATISDGSVMPYERSTPPVHDQTNATKPGQRAPVLADEVTPKNPSGSSAPAVMAPMVLNRQTPRPISVPPINGHVDHPTPDHPGQPDDYVHWDTTSPPARSVTPRRTDKQGDSDKPIGPVKPSKTGKSGGTGRPAGTGNPSDVGNPSATSSSGGPGNTAESNNSGNPHYPVNLDYRDKAADAGKPITPGTPTQDGAWQYGRRPGVIRTPRINLRPEIGLAPRPTSADGLASGRGSASSRGPTSKQGSVPHQGAPSNVGSSSSRRSASHAGFLIDDLTTY